MIKSFCIDNFNSLLKEDIDLLIKTFSLSLEKKKEEGKLYASKRKYKEKHKGTNKSFEKPFFVKDYCAKFPCATLRRNHNWKCSI